MFVVYSVAISTHNTVNLCLSKTYIWPTCNDSLSVYRAVPLEVIYWYIQPTQTVHRWNSTWREIPDQFVIVGTCAGLVCCPKTYIEWSTRFLVLSGKLTVSCHRGTALTVLHIYLQFVMQTLGQKHWSSRHFSLLSCDSHLLRDATIFVGWLTTNLLFRFPCGWELCEKYLIHVIFGYLSYFLFWNTVTVVFFFVLFLLWLSGDGVFGGSCSKNEECPICGPGHRFSASV